MTKQVLPGGTASKPPGRISEVPETVCSYLFLHSISQSWVLALRLSILPALNSSPHQREGQPLLPTALTPQKWNNRGRPVRDKPWLLFCFVIFSEMLIYTELSCPDLEQATLVDSGTGICYDYRRMGRKMPGPPMITTSSTGTPRGPTLAPSREPGETECKNLEKCATQKLALPQPLLTTRARDPSPLPEGPQL